MVGAYLNRKSFVFAICILIGTTLGVLAGCAGRAPAPGPSVPPTAAQSTPMPSPISEPAPVPVPAPASASTANATSVTPVPLPSPPNYKLAIVGTVSFQVDNPQVTSAAQLNMGSIIGPSLLRLKDGRFRLYLQARGQSGVNIISLISADGSRWDPEPGIRIQHGEQSDIDFEAGEPFVYLDLDGKYYMPYTGRQPVIGSSNLLHKLVFAVSDDGLTWSKLNRYYADPKNRNDFASSADITILNGRYVMHYTGGLNVIRATSSDGVNWTRQNVVLPAGHDSTMVQYEGVYYMFVKVPHVLAYPPGLLEMETDDLIMAVSSDGENWSPNLYQVIVKAADGSEIANTDLQDPGAILYPDGSLRIFLNSDRGLRIYSIKPSGSLPKP